MRSLLGPAERGRFVWASAEPSSHGPREDEVVLVQGSFGRRGRRSALRDMTLHARALADELLALAAARSASAIWIVLHGVGVPIAAHLVRRGSLPVHVSVHDDPPYGIALRSRRYLPLVPAIARDFAAAMRGAASIDVVSDPMIARYAAWYGVDSFPIRRTIASLPGHREPYDRSGGLSVGVLGNTYRIDPLIALGRALSLAADRCGVSARLTILGHRPDEKRLRRALGRSVELAIPGHLDEAAAVEILRSSFLLHLGYPFRLRDRVLGQTSFPAKLTTYIQAERPLLVHAPVGSSLSPLLAYDGYGTPWSSMNVREGARILERCWNDDRLLASATDAAERVRLRYFEPATNRAMLFRALNRLPSVGGSVEGDR